MPVSPDILTARIRWTPAQRGFWLGGVLGLGVLAGIDASSFVFAASVGLLAGYTIVVGVKVLAVLAGLLRRFTVTVPDRALDALRDETLPVYTVLVPLYHEGNVVPSLLRALERIDYPRDRLDVKLLLESDDPETAEALARQEIPAGIGIVVVPPGVPGTKPRACNEGLALARGEFLVIYDAEDRPEPDQLKKAVAAFRSLPPAVACLQARLNFYNAFDNLLTRGFALEYTTWFDLYLPGLYALGAPIPLGGTSNHFRADVLVRVGGWDPWNVTEDCDLGVRLARGRWKTRILDSTTWEEAPSRPGVWLRQRSRWVKGYWQTLLVHTRRPWRTVLDLGPWKYLQMLLAVGGQVATLLLNPVAWAAFFAGLALRVPVFHPESPWTMGFFAAALALLLFNGLFVLIHVLGALRRGMGRLAPWAALLPFYWILMSLGAWRGFLQFFGATFFWEKTTHGMARTPRRAARREMAAPGWAVSAAGVFVLLAAATGAVVGVSVLVPRWLKFPEKIRLAAISVAGEGAEHEIRLDKSWFGKSEVLLEVSLRGAASRGGSRGTEASAAGGAPPSAAVTASPLCRVMVFLKVGDGEWYQRLVESVAAEGGRLRIVLPLADGWRDIPAGRPWGPWCLRRVRGVGVRVFSEGGELAGVRLERAEARGAADPGPLVVTAMEAPATVPCRAVFEARFSIGREFENPFDPAQADIWGVFTAPSGAVERIPAFYTQEYHRWKEGNAERLRPEGAPGWRVRYAPREPGDYRWRVEGKDARSGAFTAETRGFTSAPSDRPGYVKVHKDGRHFALENGEFLYPVAINVRSPRDDRNSGNWDFPLPSASEGLYRMEDYLNRMSRAGMNVMRTWMTPWWAGIEWNRQAPGFHGLGIYNLENAWRLDGLLDQAEKKGMWIDLALNSHGPFTTRYDSQWDENPYNRRLGGPVGGPGEVLTNSEAKRHFRNRFRYIIARYGASPALFSWVLWIEVNVVNEDADVLRAWHAELGDYFRRLDLGRHPVSTEFNNDVGFPEIWRLRGIDYTQLAAYNVGSGLVRNLEECVEPLAQYPKPMILEEYGGHWSGGGMKMLAQEIHDGLWAGWMMPLGGTPMAWWWNFVLEKGLGRHYRRFAEFIRGEDLRDIRWNFGRVEIAGDPHLTALVRRGPDRAYVWVYYPYFADIAVDRGGTGRHEPITRAYESRTRGKFDPLADPAAAMFRAVEGASIEFPGMEAGDYAVEFWDTWSAKPPETAKFTADGGRLVVKLPALTRDVAVKVRKIVASRPLKNRLKS
ncbi:MAG: glycosyltransferase [Planctomycetota bacterium]